jgi:aryl-alcohol dehydrogenase-like predicted oxidoreductase
MEYRTLGQTGLRVSVFGIGTWQLAGPVTIDGKPDGFPDPGRDKAVALIRAAADLGINVIDTAPIYGAGEGERRVGDAIHSDRDRWVVVTKFGLGRGSAGERIVDASAAAIRPSVEASLQRLRTDHVDVLLYHSPPHLESIDAGRCALEDLRREGKIRFHGISSDDPAEIHRLGGNGADVAEFDHSVARTPGEILDVVRRHGLGTLIRGALDRGRIAAAGLTPPVFAADDIRSLWGCPASAGPWERWRPADVSPTVFALRYLLDLDSTHSILLGARSTAQIREAVTALETAPLSAAAHAALAMTRPRQAPALLIRVLDELRRGVRWIRRRKGPIRSPKTTTPLRDPERRRR